ncbi:MAG: Rieske 2Fe-2S domain-containing protein, partial [Sphingomonadaceae bacterium]
MAGWSNEMADGLLARRIFDRNIVMFRTETGVAALADRCPHRF